MLDIYTVTFIGHRYIDRFSFVEEKVEEIVRELVGSKPYVDFLVGRDGDFDQIVSSTILRVKKRVFDANSSLIWVMPYETAEYRDNVESFEEYYDEVELCQESASAHFKSAIQIRNRCMVDRADLLICYVEKESGGAYQTMQYALKAGKKVINIYDDIFMDLQQMMHGAANGGLQFLGVNVAAFTFCAASLLAIALPDGIPVGGRMPGLSTIPTATVTANDFVGDG